MPPSREAVFSKVERKTRREIIWLDSAKLAGILLILIVPKKESVNRKTPPRISSVPACCGPHFEIGQTHERARAPRRGRIQALKRSRGRAHNHEFAIVRPSLFTPPHPR